MSINSINSRSNELNIAAIVKQMAKELLTIGFIVASINLLYNSSASAITPEQAIEFIKVFDQYYKGVQNIRNSPQPRSEASPSYNPRSIAPSAVNESQFQPPVMNVEPTTIPVIDAQTGEFIEEIPFN
jgi:hypothetical protein